MSVEESFKQLQKCAEDDLLPELLENEDFEYDEMDFNSFLVINYRVK